eukprot:252195-Rhodomonas_salina.1
MSTHTHTAHEQGAGVIGTLVPRVDTHSTYLEPGPYLPLDPTPAFSLDPQHYLHSLTQPSMLPPLPQ